MTRRLLLTQILTQNRKFRYGQGSTNGKIPFEYHKVWKSYQSRKNRAQVDDHTKELMRQKVKRLQEKNGVTNYRIYTDLKLNPGNLNAWLKQGDSDKVSLETARRTLRYVEAYGVQPRVQ